MTVAANTICTNWFEMHNALYSGITSMFEEDEITNRMFPNQNGHGEIKLYLKVYPLNVFFLTMSAFDLITE